MDELENYPAYVECIANIFVSPEVEAATAAGIEMFEIMNKMGRELSRALGLPP